MTGRSRARNGLAIAACLLAMTAPLPAGAQRDAAGDAARLAAGQRILTEQCARCHAVERTGPSALPAAPPLRTLSAKYPLAHLAEALAEGITTGHAEMPEFVFTPEEIAAILAYLETISEPPAKN